MANSEADADLKSPSHLKSDVWLHFGFKKKKESQELDKSYVVCKTCKGKVKTYRGSTTNLWNHLTKNHPELDTQHKTNNKSARKQLSQLTIPKLYAEVKNNITAALKSEERVAGKGMKKRRRSPSPNGAGGEVRRFHRSEIRSMIQAEVQSAVEQTDAKMERLLEKVHQLECEPNYDFTLRKLEAHVKKLKRRGDAAIDHIGKLGVSVKQDHQKKQSQQASPVPRAKLDLPRSDSEEETTAAASDSQMIATAVRNALSVVKKEPASPPPISSSSAASTTSSSPHHQPAAQKVSIKKELLSPGQSAECEYEYEYGQGEDEHEAARVKVEPPREDPDLERNEDVFPPLPHTMFPAILSAEAASYNIPQKLTVKLALIRTPPGISVLWDMEDVDPAAPPMESYSVFMAVETSKGSGVFPEWKPVAKFPASPLPMCGMISRYKPGYRAGFTVVGKDKFGRYGPYSTIVPATIPGDTA